MAADGPPEPPAHRGGDADDNDERNLHRLRKEYLPASGNAGGQMATAGLELGLIFAVMALGGWWLDRKLGTSPWLLLTGCFVAIVGGLYRLIRRASQK